MVWHVLSIKLHKFPLCLSSRNGDILPWRATLTEKIRCGNLSTTCGAQEQELVTLDGGSEKESEVLWDGGSRTLAVDTGGQKDVKGAKPMSRTKMKLLKRKEQETEKKAVLVESFFSFYKEQYRDRWQSLLTSLQRPIQASCMLNRYADSQSPNQMFSSISNAAPLPFLQIPVFGSPDRFPQPFRDKRDICCCYLLDAASVLATQALQLTGEDNVLDLCAAPGGKSLAILQQLNLPAGSLTANEVSDDRRRRLLKVIRDYIPHEFRLSVRVTSRDGSRWSEEDLYDKVLVDVPCSSERHLIHNESELLKWTPRRSATLARRQYDLLAASLRSVHVGGVVVYSTCSISYLENDGVIAKAIKKSKVKFEVVHQSWAIGERTEYGWIVLPDVAQGWGPLYFCSLRRLTANS